jgi:predicted nuclease of predicted toxin-antitoxin system
MKLLLDSCVWGGALPEISAAGHDAASVASWPEDPGDEEVLAAAHREGRILVTLDKDFGELAIVRELPHSGIVRLVGFGAIQQGAVCLRLLEAYSEELRGGAIVTAQPGRVRIRERS